MINRKYIIVISLVILLINLSTAQSRTWDYPVKPGTPEWAAFTTGQQMVDACQIPQEILEILTTQELVQICLDYPLFLNYRAFNDERVGIEILIENFNGLQELLKREDGTKELMTVYREFPVVSRASAKSMDRHLPYKLPYLEQLISNDQFMGKLNNNELLELRKTAVNKYEKKLENQDIYSLDNIMNSMYLGAVVLKKSGYKKDTAKSSKLDVFVKDYHNASSEIVTEVSKILSEQ